MRRLEGTVVDVNLNPENGFITSLVLQDGRLEEGELFSTAVVLAAS